MQQVKLFVDLVRLKKPIGFMLLFWPCAWGLTLAYDFSTDLNNYFFYLILFFFGAVLMRSAGCIVNDILDKEFDKKVFRTKNRPIASNQISIKLAIFYVIMPNTGVGPAKALDTSPFKTFLVDFIRLLILRCLLDVGQIDALGQIII